MVQEWATFSCSYNEEFEERWINRNLDTLRDTQNNGEDNNMEIYEVMDAELLWVDWAEAVRMKRTFDDLRSLPPSWSHGEPIPPVQGKRAATTPPT